jgi:hypothetical protein
LRERLRFVASLNLLHIVEFAGIEKLGAKTREGKFRFAAKHFLDARRQTAVPTWTGDEEAAAVISCSAAASVGEIKGVKINELNGVVPALLNGRHGDYHRLGSEIQTERRVNRVRVGDLDKLCHRV